MTDINIQIFSLNCNGLNDDLKRLAVLTKLKRAGEGVYLLQETHSTSVNEQKWYQEWGNKRVCFSHGTSNSRGVALAITSNYDAKIINVINDADGRYLIADIERNGTTYTVGNLYAPTRNFEKEQQITFKKFITDLEKMTNEHTVLAGDFNLYLNPRLDKLDQINEAQDNRNYRSDIQSFMEVNNIVDIWRTINPDKKFFTWHRGNKRSRLDYILTSEHLMNFIDQCSILPGIHSDHSLLKMSLTIGNNANKGRGFWKFNSSLLHDAAYVTKVKEIITNVSENYSTINDKSMLLEIMKLEIRTQTIPYCVKLKRQKEEHERQLNKKYTILYEATQNADCSQQIWDELQQTKCQLEALERERARGIMLRSRAQWVEEGEKNTSYFLRLEKHNYCNKLITKLNVDGKEITEPSEILKSGKNFYATLYKESNINANSEQICEKIKHFTIDTPLPMLDETQKRSCEGTITESEILKSLKSFKNGTSPGTDGLTAEFYKYFWCDIKLYFLASINYALGQKQLSVEQRRGIISLIPEKDKDRTYLKNWRPISLLNLDYKILAKALGNRIIACLPHLIDEDQTGYVKGRFIGFNIRTIEDILMHTNMNNMPGIMLFVDFEKAFDSINWNFLFKCLETYNFGPEFISHVKTLYRDITATVINNGHISPWFHLERGVRQGCPLSSYLFILAAETLSTRIRNTAEIKGIYFNNTEIKITQLADDTTCFLKDKKSLQHVLDIFKDFEICSGLKVNIDKTIAKVLGPEPLPSNNLYGLTWTKDPIETLGVTLSGDEDDHYILNFKKRLKNMKNTLAMWKCRNLSLKGKVTVINTLAISPLLYLTNTIHVPPQVITEVKQIVVDFIWDGKPSKIAYNVLAQSIEDGGLKLVDFESKVKAAKIVFVKRLLDKSKARWKASAPTFLNNTHLYFQCNQSKTEKIKSKFYADVHNFWSEIQAIEQPTSAVIKNQVIWENRYITIQNKPFRWQKWL